MPIWVICLEQWVDRYSDIDMDTAKLMIRESEDERMDELLKLLAVYGNHFRYKFFSEQVTDKEVIQTMRNYYGDRPFYNHAIAIFIDSETLKRAVQNVMGN